MCLLPNLYQIFSGLLGLKMHFYGASNRKKGDIFGDIIQKYIDAVQNFGKGVVLFDGYAVSTKDCTNQGRTRKKFYIADICDDNPWPAEQKLFFANYCNKEKFIQI